MASQTLGKYRLLRQLASGGMGEVYLAKQEGPAGFAKPVVIKRILDHLAKEPAFVEMFLNEARVAALLAHPNVVQIFELGEADGTWFMAMEFIHGRTLRSLKHALREKTLDFPPGALAHIAAQALHGLHYAHSLRGEAGEPLNIVHRDMSPDNVMVGFDGQVKVLDFGIAKAASASSKTRTGTVKGKFAYMPPEQLLGHELDGRADLYAVGVVLYELLARQRPYTAATDPALVNQILNTSLTPLLQRAPEVPPALAAIVERSLEKVRENRYASAAEMAAALEAFAATTGQNTNATVSAFLRSLFGTEALDNPGVLTPSTERAVPMPDFVDVALTQTKHTPTLSLVNPPAAPTQAPAARRSWGWLALGAVTLVGAGVGLGLFSRPTTAPGTERPAPPAPTPVTVVARPPEALPTDAGPLAQREAPADAGQVPGEPDAGAEVAQATPEGSDAGSDKPAGRATRGKVHLRVNPYAEVFEGRRSLGTTPMAPVDLPVGVHVLTLKNDELKLTRTVTVRVLAGQTAVVRVDLLE